MITPRYRITLDFEGQTPPAEAMEWVENELRPHLPPDAKLSFEIEEAFSSVQELDGYLGYVVTVNKGTTLERSGLLDAVYRLDEAKSVAVLEGAAHLINNWDVVYINEGGDYHEVAVTK